MTANANSTLTKSNSLAGCLLLKLIAPSAAYISKQNFQVSTFSAEISFALLPLEPFKKLRPISASNTVWMYVHMLGCRAWPRVKCSALAGDRLVPANISMEIIV